MLHRYWFMLFLAATIVACIAARLEPSWEPTIRTWVIGGFAVAFIYGIYDGLDRIEGKLSLDSQERPMRATAHRSQSWAERPVFPWQPQKVQAVRR
jgi:hypothetical protein